MMDRVELIHVPFPDAEAREMKFKKELGESLTLTGGLTYADMADETEEEIYNYRDIERLCEQIKLLVMSKVMNQYGSEEKAIQALRSGEFGVSWELFEEAQRKYRPTPKEMIIRELEDWERQFKERTN
jgi:SpoVK/Ycf46/Vps4 family AAA+-type ATPase